MIYNELRFVYNYLYTESWKNLNKMQTKNWQRLKFSKAWRNLNYIEFKSLAFILRCYLFLLTLRAAPELPEEDLSSFLLEKRQIKKLSMACTVITLPIIRFNTGFLIIRIRIHFHVRLWRGIILFPTVVSFHGRSRG